MRTCSWEIQAFPIVWTERGSLLFSGSNEISSRSRLSSLLSPPTLRKEFAPFELAFLFFLFICHRLCTECPKTLCLFWMDLGWNPGRPRSLIQGPSGGVNSIYTTDVLKRGHGVLLILRIRFCAPRDTEYASRRRIRWWFQQGGDKLQS